jgi:hypothetical protein
MGLFQSLENPPHEVEFHCDRIQHQRRKKNLVASYPVEALALPEEVQYLSVG